MLGNPQVHALIPAAGRGERLGGMLPKQYLEINGKPVLVHTLEALASHPSISSVTVALAEDDAWFDKLRFTVGTHVRRVVGGETRAASVMNGLMSIAERHQADWVMVHDAARPCVTHHALDRLLSEGIRCGDGAILAVPIRDTVKREAEANRIASTVSRKGLWAAQTPQLFPLTALIAAVRSMLELGETPTDEAEAMERAGANPALVMGSAANIKITWPEDVDIVEAWLKHRPLAR